MTIQNQESGIAQKPEQKSPQSNSADLDRIVSELTEQSPMCREINRGQMVAFINADLINRCNLDVRTSIVLYDADRDVRYAVAEMPDETVMAALHERAGIAYWSKGV